MTISLLVTVSSVQTFLKSGLMSDLYSIQHIYVYMIGCIMGYFERTAEKALYYLHTYFVCYKTYLLDK